MNNENVKKQNQHRYRNLNESFIDYLADEFPDAAWSTTYVHWQPSVSEYCVYIDNKWCNYVPEEYIFKAGYEHYTRWRDAWECNNLTELTMDLIRNYAQTCVEFCKEKDPISIDYMEHVRYFVSTVCHRTIPREDQIIAIKIVMEDLIHHNYIAGYEYLKEVLNELES